MFRKRRSFKHLTADELKTKLYSHFDKTGSLNRMRSELRGKLVSELLKVAAPLENTSADEVIVDFDKALLPLQVSNWLVYDHLLKQGHQYALSIFVTEANLPQPEKLLTASDILCLFGLDSSTPEYKSISKMYSADNELGRLQSLLLAVIKSLLNSREDKLPMADIIERDLQDGRSKEPFDKLSPKHIVLQEKKPDSAFQNSGLPSKRPSENVPNFNKSSCLDEHFQFAIEEKEREIQSLRQKLLQELDRLHSQECSQQMEIEQERLEMRKERDVLFEEKEKLREKELLMSKEFENKLERRIREMEVDFTSKMHKKNKSQEDLQRRLFEKEQRLSQMEVDFSSQRSSYDALRKELEEMRNMCKTVQEKYSALLDDNTKLLRKFESMSDYAVVKGELEAKTHQISSLRREIDDNSKISEKEKAALTEIVRNLQMQLKGKESELLEAHRQLNVTRDTLHMEEAVWNKERRKLEQETLASRDMYKTFIRRLEDQKEDIQALHQTIHLLHYQLTEKNARSSSKLDPLMYHRVAFSKPEVTRNDPDVFRINRNFKDSPPKYKESSLKFIEDAKNRIGKLQKEADALQDKCSVVYSSVPEFNSHFFSNPSSFNVAGIRSNSIAFDQTKKFSTNLNDHFNNLIGNEMPTLDLKVPANIRSKLSSVFTDNYVPQTVMPLSAASNIASTENHSNNTTSEVSNSGLNKVVSSADALESNQNLRHTSNLKGYNFANAPERIVHQTVNLRDGISKNSRTVKAFTNSLSSNSELTARTQQEKLAFTTQSASSKKPAPTESDFPPHESEMLESLFQTRRETLINPNTLTSKEQEIGGTRSADFIPSTSPGELKPDKLQQAVEGLAPEPKTNLFFKETIGLVPPVKNDSVPVVIDLDAAWKRKTSLVPSDPPNEHTHLLKLPSLNKNVILESDLNTTPVDWTEMKSTLPKSCDKESIYTLEDNKNSSTVSDEHSMQSSHKGDHISSLPNISENIQDSKDLDTPQHAMKFVDEEHHSQSDDALKATDMKMVEDLASSNKPVQEDSLSELSEIHLSCGSEQEQQKEDSDNW